LSLGELAIVGCAPQIKQAEPAHATKGATSAEDERTYARTSLKRDGGKWVRSDGSYPFGALTLVAQEFPESEAVYQQARSRAQLLGIPAALGGGLIGATFGWNIAGAKETHMSTNTQIALYATGAGLAALAIVLSVATHNPADDFADVYDASLRRRLGLPPVEAARDAKTTVSWTPRPTAQGLGWVF
jgi:hypothetical protein